MKEDTSDPPYISRGMSDVHFLLSLGSHIPFPEACALKWENCNPEKGCLFLPSPDGRRPAMLLYLREEQKAWLQNRREQYRRRFQTLPEKNEYVFLHYTGKAAEKVTAPHE